MSNLIPTLEMGAVTLYVKDLSLMKEFYNKSIGLEILNKNSNNISLGHGSKNIVNLIERNDLNSADKQEAGLYHIAILFDQKEELAKTLANIIEQQPDSYSGSADHLVSIAFYFTDPEGNGIELYYDRPRNEWKWENGEIVMGTFCIDPVVFIKENTQETIKPIHYERNLNKKVGHIHLKVGSIEDAKNFYVDILGFDITAQLPSAIFISYDGYHHHIGINTWESYGAGVRKETLGLATFEIMICNREKFAEVKKKLIESNILFQENKNGLNINDPWGNNIIIAK